MIAEILSLILAIACLAGIGMIVKNKMRIIASIDTAEIPAERDAAVKKRIMAERMKRNIRLMQDIFMFVGTPLAKLMQDISERVQAFYHGLLELRERHKKIPLSKGEQSNIPREEVSPLEMALRDARAFLEKEEYELAEKKCIEVIGQDKKNKEAYQILAEIYTQQREWEHAQEVLECSKKILKADIRACEHAEKDVCELEVEYANLLIDLASIYKKLEKNDRALTVIKEAVELQASNPKFLHELVDVYIITGQRLKAEKALESLRKANPENQKLSELQERIKELEY